MKEENQNPRILLGDLDGSGTFIALAENAYNDLSKAIIKSVKDKDEPKVIIVDEKMPGIPVARTMPSIDEIFPFTIGPNNIFEPEYVPIPRSERGYFHQPVRNSSKEPKYNRNQPCPCGSGKKYKYCCINKK